MSLVGHFRRSRSGGWEGDIRTLTLDVRLRLKPNDNQTSPKAPAFRAMVGWSHVGDAWETQTRSRPSRPMVRVHLDDPLFSTPISMVLLPDEGGDTAVMVWQRTQPRQRVAGESGSFEPGVRDEDLALPDVAAFETTGDFENSPTEALAAGGHATGGEGSDLSNTSNPKLWSKNDGRA